MPSLLCVSQLRQQINVEATEGSESEQALIARAIGQVSEFASDLAEHNRKLEKIKLDELKPRFQPVLLLGWLHYDADCPAFIAAFDAWFVYRIVAAATPLLLLFWFSRSGGRTPYNCRHVLRQHAERLFAQASAHTVEHKVQDDADAAWGSAVMADGRDGVSSLAGDDRSHGFRARWFGEQQASCCRCRR